MGAMKALAIELHDDPAGYDAFIAAPVLTRAAGELVATMRAEGITDPLGEPVTLAAVLHDLFTLAGVPVPREVAARIAADA